jgi:hypothetical protein
VSNKSSSESAVAGGGDFDEGSSASVGYTFPIDLVSDSGQGELTFEVGARSNLDVVEVSLLIAANNNLSVDGVDVSEPVLQFVAIEVVVIEIFLI